MVLGKLTRVMGHDSDIAERGQVMESYRRLPGKRFAITRLYVSGNDTNVWRVVFPGAGLKAGKLLGGFCNSPGEGLSWHPLA